MDTTSGETAPTGPTITLPLDFTPYLSRKVGEDRETGETISEPITMEEVVLDAAVRQFVAGLDREVRQEMSRRVAAIRDEMIREQVAPIITEALSGEITRTNHYGEPTGQRTTLREIITAEAQKDLMLHPRDDRSGYSNSTPATKVMRDEVANVVAREVRAIVAEVKAETYDYIRAAAAEAIAKAATTP